MVNPKFSIITVCFNSYLTIRDTIESVVNQTYNNIEYIIIDGSSRDNTIKIINEYKKYISCIISEPDQGIYDAMNKGVKLATGDFVAILNSDDIYADKYVIEKITEYFLESNVECIYGDLAYVNSEDTTKIIRYWKSSPYVKGSFLKGWHPPHPSFFVRKSVYEKLGNYDTNIKLSADFDFMLRVLEVHNISCKYIPSLCVRMRVGGASNNSLVNILTGNKYIYFSFKKYGINVNIFFYFTRRFMSKILQFFH